MPAVNLPKGLHRPVKGLPKGVKPEQGYYGGNYATSTGSVDIATAYQSKLRKLLEDERYGEAFIMDLRDKINLVVHNKAVIDEANKVLKAPHGLAEFKNDFKNAVEYANKMGLITKAEHDEAKKLIEDQMAKFRETPQRDPAVGAEMKAQGSDYQKAYNAAYKAAYQDASDMRSDYSAYRVAITPEEAAYSAAIGAGADPAAARATAEISSAFACDDCAECLAKAEHTLSKLNLNRPSRELIDRNP